MSNTFLLMDAHRRLTTRRTGTTFLISLAIHVVVFSLAVVLPLWVIRAIPQEEIIDLLIVPPPVLAIPPLPTPPAGGSESPLAATSRTVSSQEFVPPDQIPEVIPPPPEAISLMPGFEPGQAAEGSATPGPFGGTGLGGSLGDALNPSAMTVMSGTTLPPRPPKVRPAPLLLGGNVLQSKLLHRVEPVYPPLARQARISGVVYLQVMINEEGDVEDIKVIQGHPLLNGAATQAVKQWRYSPTLLNDEPVPVTATVTVNFTLRCRTGFPV